MAQEGQEMIVKVCKESSAARIPKKAHGSDFCYDVYATSGPIEVAPHVLKYEIGLRFEIVRGTQDGFDDSPCNLSIDFRPRSSVWKTGLALCNCEGTIDEAYRGVVSAYFYEVVPGMDKYKEGDRVGQIKLGISFPMEFIEAPSLAMDTERGESGFGSSGR